MDKKQKNKQAIIAAGIALVLLATAIFAYFSSFSKKKNEFNPGNDTAEITESHKPPDELTQDNQYTKAVWVENESNIDVYVRVYVGFTDSDVMSVTKFSNSTATKQENIAAADWYYAEPKTPDDTKSYYRNHLPENWIYKAIDANSGYYYYTIPLKPEDDKSTANIVENQTTTLFRWVNTAFNDDVGIEAYGILLYYDSVQAYDKDGVYIPASYTESGETKNGYEKAWSLWETTEGN